MRKVRVLFGGVALLGAVACGADGAAGAEGAAGKPGAEGATGPSATGSPESSISLVEPRVAVLAGRVDVAVSVDGADLDPASTLSFGDAIKVTSVTLAGKRALRARLEVDPKAAVGFRDVVITSGGVKLTATQGFQVAPALGVKVSGGKPEQGGLVQVDIANNDAEWFDPDNLTVSAQIPEADGPLVLLSTRYVGPRDGRLVLLADPGLRTGPLALVATNYPDEPNPPLYLGAPGAITVAARTPEALSATALDKVLDQPFATALLKYTTGINKLNVVTIVPTGELRPLVIGMGKGGRLKDLISQAATQIYPTTEVGSGSLIVGNRTFEGGADPVRFGYRVSAVSLDGEAPHAEITTSKHDGTGITPFDDWGAAPPASTAAVPVRLLRGELVVGDTADVYRLGPFPAGATNLEISAFSEVPVTLAISDAVEFPAQGANTASFALGYSAGLFGSSENGAKIAHGARQSSASFRFVRVRPFNTKRGKYTLAARSLP